MLCFPAFCSQMILAFCYMSYCITIRIIIPVLISLYHFLISLLKLNRQYLQIWTFIWKQFLLVTLFVLTTVGSRPTGNCLFSSLTYKYVRFTFRLYCKNVQINYFLLGNWPFCYYSVVRFNSVRMFCFALLCCFFYKPLWLYGFGCIGHCQITFPLLYKFLWSILRTTTK